MSHLPALGRDPPARRRLRHPHGSRAARPPRRRDDDDLASTTQAALAAKSATKTVPIVIPITNDPVGSGLVKSIARPGENLTGFSLLTEDLVGKRLELLKELVPRTTSLAVLLNPTNPVNVTVELKATERAASLLGLTVHSFPARDPHQLVKALEDITAQRTDALLLLSDRLFVTERKTLAEFGAQRRLPVMHFAPEFADAGGLAAYGPNVAAMYRRASVLVDKILKGAKPAEMPVEQASQFELVINLKTARALGLTVPGPLLLRAHRVLE